MQFIKYFQWKCKKYSHWQCTKGVGKTSSTVNIGAAYLDTGSNPSLYVIKAFNKLENENIDKEHEDTAYISADSAAQSDNSPKNCDEKEIRSLIKNLGGKIISTEKNLNWDTTLLFHLPY